MPDPVDRAVDAQIEAHRPDRVPPFGMIEARRRRRDRRRLAAGAAALSLAAVAGAGLVVPSLTGGGDRLTPAGRPTAQGGPSGSEPAATFAVVPDGTPADSTAGDALARCLSLPDLTWRQSFGGAPAMYTVVAQADAVDRFDACIGGVPGYAAVPIPQAAVPFVERCVGDGRQYVVPSLVGLTEDQALRSDPTTGPPAVRSSRVVGRDGDCLPVTADLRTDRADLIVQDGRVVWASLPDPAVTGPTTAHEVRGFPWTGVRICIAGGAETCRTVDAETARELDTLLLAAEPAPPGQPYCQALSTVYRILFSHPSARPVPIEVPRPCGPMKRGNQDYLLDDIARDAVKAAFDAGSPTS